MEIGEKENKDRQEPFGANVIAANIRAYKCPKIPACGGRNDALRPSTKTTLNRSCSSPTVGTPRTSAPVDRIAAIASETRESSYLTENGNKRDEKDIQSNGSQNTMKKSFPSDSVQTWATEARASNSTEKGFRVNNDL